MDAPFPAQIGRFRIKSLLGRGAMGVVYKAHDPEIDRPVAIKLIRADLLGGESRQDYLTRFRNEAKVAGRCVHTNIVGMYDYSVHDDSPYLVMEYVNGVDLGRAFRNRMPVDDTEVVRIALQVLDALGYAHSLGIVHRDIKPGNILLTAQAGLKVADFGISRLMSFEATQSAAIVGTPSYMSPEQCRGAPVDGRCDLFSLGCVMYELLCGERAFSGVNYAETVYKLIHEPHRPLGDRRPGIPASLATIVDRVLAKVPDDRFDGASTMAAELRSLHRAAPATSAPGAEVGATIVLPAIDDPSFDAHLSSGAASRRTGADLPDIDDPSLATIERRLASYFGPMAGYQIRHALQRARTPVEFCELLSSVLPEGEIRDSFMRDALALTAGTGAVSSTRGGPGSTAAEREAVHAAAELDALTRALTQVMGPIAPHLIRRMQARAFSPPELEASCVAMIDNPRERLRFSQLLAQYRHQ